MKNKFNLTALLILMSSISAFSQIIFMPIPMDKVPSDYEHGFLPGKKFPFYSTIDKYNFNDINIRVELNDDRFGLNLNHIKCSDVDISNTSEYKDPKTIYKVKDYIDSIFSQSKIKIDSSSTNILQINLEALDARLIGFGYIRVHGLCQIKFRYMDFEQTYCVDIMDGDAHAPVGKNDFVTRRTATRKMLSASVREAIEKFLIDLKSTEKYKTTANNGYKI
jgi:hypothetical protein